MYRTRVLSQERRKLNIFYTKERFLSRSFRKLIPLIFRIFGLLRGSCQRDFFQFDRNSRIYSHFCSGGCCLGAKLTEMRRDKAVFVRLFSY